MLKRLLLFSLLVWAISSNAQVTEITGLVTYNNERQSGAIIKNVSSRAQTISSDRGEFVIKAKPGDTLITIKDDYINDTLLVSGQQYLIIKFRKKPMMLKEVNIYGMPVTPASIYEGNKNEYKEIYWKGDKSPTCCWGHKWALLLILPNFTTPLANRDMMPGGYSTRSPKTIKTA